MPELNTTNNPNIKQDGDKEYVVCRSCQYQFERYTERQLCSNCFACTGCERYICPQCDGRIEVIPVKPMSF